MANKHRPHVGRRLARAAHIVARSVLHFFKASPRERVEDAVKQKFRRRTVEPAQARAALVTHCPAGPAFLHIILWEEGAARFYIPNESRILKFARSDNRRSGNALNTFVRCDLAVEQQSKR